MARKPSYFSSKIQSGSSEGIGARFRQHGLDVLPATRRLGAFSRSHSLAERVCPLAGARADPPPEAQKGMEGVVVRLPDAAAHVTVAGFLDQQPFLARLALDPHQRPHSLQLEAFELEEELARLHPLARVAHRAPQAPVPDDHRPGAILAVRDHAFEVRVLDRVILGLHRQPLFGGIRMRTPGNRPGLQDAVPLQPQVVVHARSAVFLHDKTPGRAAPAPIGSGVRSADRLRRYFVQQFGHFRAEVIIHAP